MKEELIRVLRELGVVYREPVVGVSGKLLEYYVDVKKAYGNPRALRLISKCLWEIIDKNATCIAAMGYGGISPASVISAQQGLHLALIRDTPKQHGKGGFIDGYVPTFEDKVAIIDDVFTTGGSLRKILSAIEPTKAQVLGCCVVVKRGDGELGVPLRWLLKVEELM